MRFFVTHGRGLETFVQNELKGRYNTELQSLNIAFDKPDLVGKIFFSVAEKTTGETLANEELDFSRTCEFLVKRLKSVERLFCLLFVNPDFKSDGIASRSRVLKALFEYVNTEISSTVVPLTCLSEYWSDVDTGRDDAPGPKKQKLAKSFRVNAKVSGVFKKIVYPREVASCVGSALIKTLGKDGWVIDLKRPLLEISFYLTDEGVICGVPLTRIPLSERPYLEKIPLRSTVAFSMAALGMECLKTDGDPLFVLDPMCGSATILVELIKNFPQAAPLAFGIDISTDQISQAVTNVTKSGVSDKVIIIRADSCSTLPFHSSVLFDSVVCDLPFGLQHGTEESVRRELPAVIRQVSALVKSNGNIVLLISTKLSPFLEKLCQEEEKWILQMSYDVNLGVLPAIIYHFKR